VACRILFGPDIRPSREFLDYLQEEGIVSAFRQRAMDVHPDRARFTSLSVEKCQKEFIALQAASEILREHIAVRQGENFQKNNNQFAQKSSSGKGALPKTELPFGRFLYYLGIIEWRQLIKALAWQKSGRPRIGELGIKCGYLERNSIGIILKNSGVKSAFGWTAYRLGFLSKDEVRDLLRRQRRQQKRIGQFFVENGVFTRLELEVLLGRCRKHNIEVRRIT